MDFICQQTVLANGLRLVQVPLPTDSVTVLCLVGAGSKQETPATSGLSHFLEHLVFKGTKKYPGSFNISSTIDGIGAEFNAYTGKEETGFYVKSAVSHLELALEVVAQLVFQPLLKPADLEQERGVIIQEINMREDQPMMKVGEIFNSLMYAQASLGWKIIGTKKNILNLQKKDFDQYRRRLYHPQNMVLVLAGGQPDQALNLVKKHFSMHNNNTAVVDRLLPARNQEIEPSKQTVKLIHKPIEQAHFCLGVRALPRCHADRYVLAVLTAILGGGMSSRLFTEIREKRGLAYYVRSQGEDYLPAGHFVSQAGTDVNKAEEAIKLVLAEYKKIGRHLPEKELVKAKEFIKGRLVLSLEDSRSVASMVADDLLLEGKIRGPKKLISGINRVSSADVCRLAQEIFQPEAMRLAVVGPFKDKEKFVKLLN
ncbi:insulinase family protein [Patescibacteria group bacterium]|nr:insulinase family protein [Patescibacteria group bacterium]MBU1931823.1 insulinase family protein [Patescibacteria group bacterium]